MKGLLPSLSHIAAVGIAARPIIQGVASYASGGACALSGSN
jgi:hypothetical protein